ncbi:hypothetical protein H4582DRAFT_1946437 [Lactarius indigo]|nr:hypothetical protein H4582DRAFT_1946437 [Lactarius indigo]
MFYRSITVLYMFRWLVLTPVVLRLDTLRRPNWLLPRDNIVRVCRGPLNSFRRHTAMMPSYNAEGCTTSIGTI